MRLRSLEQFAGLAVQVERVSSAVCSKMSKSDFAEGVLALRFPCLSDAVQPYQLLACLRIEGLGDEPWSLQTHGRSAVPGRSQSAVGKRAPDWRAADRSIGRDVPLIANFGNWPRGPRGVTYRGGRPGGLRSLSPHCV